MISPNCPARKWRLGFGRILEAQAGAHVIASVKHIFDRHQVGQVDISARHVRS
jgi:hypothetical protein